MQITRLEAPRCRGGENPMWDPDRRRLYYVDNVGRQVHAFDLDTGATRSLGTPSVVTTLVLRQAGNAVITMRTGIHFFDLETGALDAIRPMTEPPPFVFNDGKVDAAGRFVIGASTANAANPQPDGGLFRLDPDLSLTRLDQGIHYSNGPCWSMDGRTLYFSDSWLKSVYAYDYEPATGDVARRRLFLDTTPLGGLPDGATVDASGLYWVALYGAGKVAAVRPDGTVDRTVDLPVPHVSSVAFGGADLDRLFVTTIEHDGDGGGHLYVIDELDAQGLVEHRFAG